MFAYLDIICTSPNSCHFSLSHLVTSNTRASCGAEVWEGRIWEDGEHLSQGAQALQGLELRQAWDNSQ